jgi:transaldolase
MQNKFKIKIFADFAVLEEMKAAYKEGVITGFTTNPTLMKKAGVSDYRQFAVEVLKEIPDLPISFEVFSDDFEAMEKEALEIAGWGKNVKVKIPITNTKGESSIPLIARLLKKNLSLNITAILLPEQVAAVAKLLSPTTEIIISVFAGRIADTGRDPVPYMKECSQLLKQYKGAQLLWASSRELFNIYQAEACGCQIITVTNEILKKLAMIDKDLKELSLDTVKMFFNDASKAGFRII